MTYKLTLFLSSLIILVGLFLRTFYLDSLPIFADEAIYVRWSQVMRVESGLRFLPLSDGKQPLYMWATIPFLKLIPDPLIAARTFSALAGIATVIVVGCIAYFLFDHTFLSGLIAAGVFSVLPFSVFFSRLAMVDTLLTFFMALTFLFSYLSFRFSRLDMAMLAGFALGGAWLTKSPAIFAILLLPLGIFLIPGLSLKKLLVPCTLYIVTFTIAFGMYNILRLGTEFHMIALRNKDYIYPLAEILRHPLDPLIPHLKDSWAFYLYFLTPVGLLFFIITLLSPHHHRPKLVLLAWILIPVLTQSAIARGFTARYLLFTVPFVVLFLVAGIQSLGRKLVLPATALLVFSSLFIDYLLITRPTEASLPRIEQSGYLEEWTAGFGIKAISDYLVRRPAVPMVVGAEGYFGTPFDGLKVYLNSRPHIRVIGTGINLSAVPLDLLNATADNEVYWVVNSDRFAAAPPQGLKLLASYPKATKPDGTRNYLYFFQVLPQ